MTDIEKLNIEKETVLLTLQVVEELIKNIDQKYRNIILSAFKEALDSMSEIKETVEK